MSHNLRPLVGIRTKSDNDKIKMSTKLQKRKTKQIRIGDKFHKAVKLEAIKRGKTISKTVDEIIFIHFNNKDKTTNYKP